MYITSCNKIKYKRKFTFIHIAQPFINLQDVSLVKNRCQISISILRAGPLQVPIGDSGVMWPAACFPVLPSLDLLHFIEHEREGWSLPLRVCLCVSLVLDCFLLLHWADMCDRAVLTHSCPGGLALPECCWTSRWMKDQREADGSLRGLSRHRNAC